MSQLIFGLMSGVEKFEPFAAGDVVVKASGDRYAITHVADEGVFVAVNLKTGRDAVLFEREIAYRSRKAAR